jgi:hypothetical protein
MARTLLLVAMFSAMVGYILGHLCEHRPRLHAVMVVCWGVSFVVAAAVLTTAAP